MTGYGSMLAGFYQSTSDAARARFRTIAEVGGKTAATWKAAKEKIQQKVAYARQAVNKKLTPQPAGATIEACPNGRKAERVAKRRAKIAASKDSLKSMPPGKQRDALQQATTRFERNNVAVERARLAEDVYNVGQGEPPEGWERVSPQELAKLGMTESMFPQLDPKFRPDEYKDGYYPELYKTKPDIFGEVRYVLAFRGTQGRKDGVTDMVQAFGGETDHYTRAIKTARSLKKVMGDKFDITGHSMGGGMAAAAGIVSGTCVYAIDPAGVHPATLERVENSDGLASACQYVQNFVAEGEILDTVQAPAFQRAVGAGITTVSTTGGCAIALAAHRAVMDEGTITFAAAGPVHRVPIITNATDVLGGKSEQGLSPGLGGTLRNRFDPVRKVHLHDPKYVIAGLEQQKADDLNVMDRNITA